MQKTILLYLTTNLSMRVSTVALLNHKLPEETGQRYHMPSQARSHHLKTPQVHLSVKKNKTKNLLKDSLITDYYPTSYCP